MIKLEIRHLAPYIPYGLEYVNIPHGGIHTVDGIYWDIKDVFNHTDGDVPYVHIEPILRPLSDYKLFEDILDEMTENDISMLEELPDFVLRLPYDVIQKMLEHHIDIFWLIPQGLATDKNIFKYRL